MACRAVRVPKEAHRAERAGIEALEPCLLPTRGIGFYYRVVPRQSLIGRIARLNYSPLPEAFFRKRGKGNPQRNGANGMACTKLTK